MTHRMVFSIIALFSSLLVTPAVWAAPTVMLSPTQGPPGTTVQVQACGFMPSTGVTGIRVYVGGRFSEGFASMLPCVKGGGIGFGQDAGTSPFSAPIIGISGQQVLIEVHSLNGGIVVEKANAVFTITSTSGTVPSPGEPTQSVGTACHPVINEILTGTAASPREEFVELFNPCPTAFNLQGFTLVYRFATDSRLLPGPDCPSCTIGLQGLLQPGGYIVYGGADYRGLSNGVLMGGGLAGGIEANGALALQQVTNLSLIDSVGFGQVSGNFFMEGIAAPSASPGFSISRSPNGADTNNNGNDFKVTSPTPMGANMKSGPGSGPPKGGKK
jgi:hypothetical protein